MKNTLWKTTIREIKSSLGRFLAILAIVALGVGMFAGLKVTQPFVLAAAQQYYEKHDFFDFHLLTSYGLEAEDVAYLSAKPQVKAVEGAYTYDVLATFDNSENTTVIKVHSLPKEVNGVELLYGRMPANTNECLVDSRLYGEEAIGSTFVISNENEEDTLEFFSVREFTISGVVPVVGGILSDASEAVLVGAGIMKNAAGIYGLLAILSITALPFLRIGIQYLMLKFTGAVCAMYCEKSHSQLIQNFSTAMGLLLAMTGAVSLIFLISTVCLMKGLTS